MRYRVFVDTNAFLHLRDLKDLAWSEVLQDVEELDILVAPVVVDELDRLKTDKGGRIRDRSRAALKQIEQASIADGMRLELRRAGPRIWLEVTHHRPFPWVEYPRLDHSRNDDRLIAAALSEPEGPAPILVSFDTAPLIRARLAGLAAIRSPEAWALPPMKDEAEQKLARLERELAAAKATKPAIQLLFPDMGKDGVVRPSLLKLEPLSKEIQKSLLDVVVQNHPKHKVAGSRPLRSAFWLGRSESI